MFFFSDDFHCFFVDLLMGFSGPRSGLDGIFELLEATWKLLDPHLGRYDSALKANLALLDHSWSALGAFQGGRADAGRARGELRESSVRAQ